MEFTGYYYSLYFEKSIDKIISKLKKLNYMCNITNSADENTFFFYKNEEMYSCHLENGYNTDINNEGCFCLETKTLDMNGTANWIDYPDIPFYVDIKNINYIFLILPDRIDNSNFCKNIYNIIVDEIKSEK